MSYRQYSSQRGGAPPPPAAVPQYQAPTPQQQFQQQHPSYSQQQPLSRSTSPARLARPTAPRTASPARGGGREGGGGPMEMSSSSSRQQQAPTRSSYDDAYDLVMGISDNNFAANRAPSPPQRPAYNNNQNAAVYNGSAIDHVGDDDGDGEYSYTLASTSATMAKATTAAKPAAPAPTGYPPIHPHASSGPAPYSLQRSAPPMRSSPATPTTTSSPSMPLPPQQRRAPSHAPLTRTTSTAPPVPTTVPSSSNRPVPPPRAPPTTRGGGGGVAVPTSRSMSPGLGATNRGVPPSIPTPPSARAVSPSTTAAGAPRGGGGAPPMNRAPPSAGSQQQSNIPSVPLRAPPSRATPATSATPTSGGNASSSSMPSLNMMNNNRIQQQQQQNNNAVESFPPQTSPRRDPNFDYYEQRLKEDELSYGLVDASQQAERQQFQPLPKNDRFRHPNSRSTSPSRSPREGGGVQEDDAAYRHGGPPSPANHSGNSNNAVNGYRRGSEENYQQDHQHISAPPPPQPPSRYGNYGGTNSATNRMNGSNGGRRPQPSDDEDDDDHSRPPPMLGTRGTLAKPPSPRTMQEIQAAYDAMGVNDEPSSVMVSPLTPRRGAGGGGMGSAASSTSTAYPSQAGGSGSSAYHYESTYTHNNNQQQNQNNNLMMMGSSSSSAVLPPPSTPRGGGGNTQRLDRQIQQAQQQQNHTASAGPVVSPAAIRRIVAAAANWTISNATKRADIALLEEENRNVIRKYINEGGDPNVRFVPPNTNNSNLGGSLSGNYMQANNSAYGANNSRDVDEYSGLTPLHAAVRYGHADCVELFLATNRVLINNKDSRGISITMDALYYPATILKPLVDYSLQKVNQLLSFFASPFDMQDSTIVFGGVNAMIAPLYEHNKSYTEDLGDDDDELGDGDDENPRDVDENANGHSQLTTRKSGNRNGAAGRSGGRKKASLLEGVTLDVTSKDAYGRTPLHVAATEGLVDAMRQLFVYDHLAATLVMTTIGGGAMVMGSLRMSATLTNYRYSSGGCSSFDFAAANAPANGKKGGSKKGGKNNNNTNNRDGADGNNNNGVANAAVMAAALALNNHSFIKGASDGNGDGATIIQRIDINATTGLTADDLFASEDNKRGSYNKYSVGGDDGVTPLHLSLANGQFEAAEFLCGQQDILVNKTTTISGYSPLIVAACISRTMLRRRFEEREKKKAARALGQSSSAADFSYSYQDHHHNSSNEAEPEDEEDALLAAIKQLVARGADVNHAVDLDAFLAQLTAAASGGGNNNPSSSSNNNNNNKNYRSSNNNGAKMSTALEICLEKGHFFVAEYLLRETNIGIPSPSSPQCALLLYYCCNAVVTTASSSPSSSSTRSRSAGGRSASPNDSLNNTVNSAAPNPDTLRRRKDAVVQVAKLLLSRGANPNMHAYVKANSSGGGDNNEGMGDVNNKPASNNNNGSSSVGVVGRLPIVRAVANQNVELVRLLLSTTRCAPSSSSNNTNYGGNNGACSFTNPTADVTLEEDLSNSSNANPSSSANPSPAVGGGSSALVEAASRGDVEILSLVLASLRVVNTNKNNSGFGGHYGGGGSNNEVIMGALRVQSPPSTPPPEPPKKAGGFSLFGKKKVEEADVDKSSSVESSGNALNMVAGTSPTIISTTITTANPTNVTAQLSKALVIACCGGGTTAETTAEDVTTLSSSTNGGNNKRGGGGGINNSRSSSIGAANMEVIQMILAATCVMPIKDLSFTRGGGGGGGNSNGGMMSEIVLSADPFFCPFANNASSSYTIAPLRRGLSAFAYALTEGNIPLAKYLLVNNNSSNSSSNANLGGNAINLPIRLPSLQFPPSSLVDEKNSNSNSNGVDDFEFMLKFSGKFLLQLCCEMKCQKSDVQHKSASGNSASYYALPTEEDVAEIAQLLVESGADVNLVGRLGRMNRRHLWTDLLKRKNRKATANNANNSSKKRNSVLVNSNNNGGGAKKTADNIAITPYLTSPLAAAAANGNLPLMKALLRSGADLLGGASSTAGGNQSDDEYNHNAHRAETVVVTYRGGGSNIGDGPTCAEEEPLYPFYYNHDNLARYLGLSASPSASARSNNSNKRVLEDAEDELYPHRLASPLFMAAVNDQVEVIHFLIQELINEGLPLESGLERGEVVSDDDDEENEDDGGGSDVDDDGRAFNFPGTTTSSSDAVSDARDDIVTRLDLYGTPLHCAVQLNNVDLVRYLIDVAAHNGVHLLNINACRRRQITAATALAVKLNKRHNNHNNSNNYNTNNAAVSNLTADRSVYDETPLHVAIAKGHEELSGILMYETGAVVLPSRLWTLLEGVVRMGRQKTIASRRGDDNKKNDDDEEEVLPTLRSYFVEMLQQLIVKGGPSFVKEMCRVGLPSLSVGGGGGAGPQQQQVIYQQQYLLCSLLNACILGNEEIVACLLLTSSSASSRSAAGNAAHNASTQKTAIMREQLAAIMAAQQHRGHQNSIIAAASSGGAAAADILSSPSADSSNRSSVLGGGFNIPTGSVAAAGLSAQATMYSCCEHHNNHTPISIAASLGHLAVVKLLVEVAGVDTNKGGAMIVTKGPSNPSGMTPSATPRASPTTTRPGDGATAADAFGGNVGGVDFSCFSGLTPLGAAIEGGFTYGGGGKSITAGSHYGEAVENFYRSGNNNNNNNGNNNNTNMTSFARPNHLDVIKYLLTQRYCPVDVNASMSNNLYTSQNSGTTYNVGDTALTLAIRGGGFGDDIPVELYYKSAAATAGSKSIRGGYGSGNVVRGGGHNTHCDDFTSDELSALTPSQLHVSVVKMLLTIGNADVNKVNNSKTSLSPLMVALVHVYDDEYEITRSTMKGSSATCNCGRTAVIMQALITKGADVAFTSPKTGMTCVHYASMRCVHLLRVILDAVYSPTTFRGKIFDINAVNNKGETAMSIALRIGAKKGRGRYNKDDDDVVRILHENGGKEGTHYTFYSNNRGSVTE